MKEDQIKNLILNNDINSDEIISSINYFLNNSSLDDIHLFFDFYRKFFSRFQESDYYNCIECIDNYLNEKIQDDELEGELYNAKTFFAILLNNKYAALDSCYKYKALKINNTHLNFLNFNYLLGIYYEQGLYNEAFIERDDFFVKNNLSDLDDYSHFVYAINFAMIYAKLKEYDKYLELYEEAYLASSKSDDLDEQISLKIARISAESILYFDFKDKIDIEKNINEYKEILKNYFNRNLLSFDTIDTHVEIISALIKMDRLEDAKEICIDILNNLKTINFKKEIYRCLRIIYKKTSDKKIYPYMVKYLDTFEEISRNEKVFYNKYIKNAIRLYQKSNDYNLLLESYEHDTLTKCFSRGAFLNLVKESSEMNGYLIYLDLNNLKKINDNFGHNNGDEYLIVFSKNVQDIFNGIGLTYRLGGDEFVVLSKQTTDEEVINSLNQLKNNLLNLTNDYPQFDFSFSAGIAKFKPYLRFEEVLNQADQAMYSSKKGKKSFYNFYK